ncbi:unnamed protein product [Triticum turgidum subsp. durum]|uniref:linoleate 9S-lipoxygenase n=1 Tax=Triticum turgidum subsp. durum TaxID=4567 RepID=A0A9R0XGZ0_TRITD|nr:unnamed protein product [Triticum turgidum subsp. durum]
MFGVGGIVSDLTGGLRGPHLKGSVVLMRKNALDFNDFGATVMDGVTELLGRGVTCQLISSTHVDHNNGGRGKVGAEANLEQWLLPTNLPFITTGENKFAVTFDWSVDKLGVPGAIIVKNNHAAEFFLKTITLDNVPGRGTVVFVANSWVYPQAKYRYNRVFFANDAYLPHQMPAALKPYRDDELRNLRGDDQQGPYEDHDRVYRYDVYNDLGDTRDVLGGSKDLPYPRRCRTGRKPSATKPDHESRLLPLVGNVYVPRDELFGHLKQSDFLGYTLKALVDGIIPAIRTYVDLSPGEFDSFADILKLYEGGIKLPNIPALEEVRKRFPLQLVKDLIPMGGDFLLKLPKPQIIKADEKAWMTDEEFAREMLAGVNPMMIKRLTEFPPKSTLDPSKYGDHTSTITEAHIGKSLEGLTVEQALAGNRLYIVDQHDNLMPFLVDINNLDGSFVYATRTLLFLRGDGTLAPVAIELSSPLIQGDLTTAKSTVYTPQHAGVEGWIWQLAKAYASVNDYGWHQLISHWLNTHAVMEPFVIATNRQLSVTHPVYKLLHPQARHAHVLHGLQELELHRTSSARRSDQEGHGSGGPIEPAQGAAPDRGLPVRGGRAGGVARHRAVGDRVPDHLLPGRRRAAGRRGAAGVVEGGAGGRARRPQGRGVVAQDADGGGADQGLRHHHLDRVGAPRGRQLRAVPLLGVPPQQAVGEPAADAGAGQRGVRPAGARPGEGLYPHHHQPVPGAGGHLADGDPVQALLRRGVPGAARHAGVDVGRQGAGGVQAVRGEAGGHREAGGGHERGPAAQEPHRAGQVPLHAALPQHLRPHGPGRGAHGQGHPQQHLHLRSSIPACLLACLLAPDTS